MSQERDLSAVNISTKITTDMKITVDLMNRDNIYLCTMRIEPELNLISDYYGNKPVVRVSALRKTIEDRIPTLKGKDYRVLPCNDNYVLHYDN